MGHPAQVGGQLGELSEPRVLAESVGQGIEIVGPLGQDPPGRLRTVSQPATVAACSASSPSPAVRFRVN